MQKIIRKIYIYSYYIVMFGFIIYFFLYIILKLYTKAIYYNYILIFLFGLYIGYEFAANAYEYLKKNNKSKDI